MEERKSSYSDVVDHDLQHTITREELYAGPGADILPDDLRERKYGDTACEACGVSFLVLSEMRELQNRVDDAEGRMASWSDKMARVKELEERLYAREDALHHTKDVILELKEELSVVKERVKGNGLQFPLLEDAVADLGRKLRSERSARVAAERMAEQFASEGEQVAELSETLDRLRASGAAERDRLLKELDKMKSELEVVRKEKKEVVEEAEGLRKEIGSVCDERDGMNVSLEASVSREKHLQSKLEEVKDGYALEKAERDKELARLKEEMQGVKKRCEELEHQVHSQRQEWEKSDVSLRATREASEKLREDFDRQSKELELERSNNRELGIAKEALQQSVDRMREGLEKERVEKTRTLDRVSELELKVSEGDKQLVEERNKREEVTQSLLESNSVSKELRTTIEDLKKQNEGLGNELIVRDQTIGELETSLADAKATIQKLQTSQSATLTDLEHVRSELRDSAETVQRLQIQVRDLSSSETLLSELREAYDSEHRRVAQLEEKMEEMVAELATLGESRDDAVYGRAEERGRRQEAEEKISLLERQVTELSKSHQDSVQALRYKIELEQAQTRIRDLEDTVHRECSERTYLLDQINTLRGQRGMAPLGLDAVASAAATHISDAEKHQSHTEKHENPHTSDPVPKLPPLSNRRHSESDEIEPDAAAAIGTTEEMRRRASWKSGRGRAGKRGSRRKLF